MSLAEREAFFLELLVDYILLNDIITGQLTEECLYKVGIKQSFRIEDQYRSIHSLKEKLAPEQFAELALVFLRSLGGEYVLQLSDPDKIVLSCFNCPFGHMVLKTPKLCQIMTGILGGIAARNFPYSKVSVESGIARKTSSCRIVFYLCPTGQAQSASGKVFTDSPTSYMLTRSDIKAFDDELLSNNPVYKKYAENLASLQSMHRELESEYNQLRDEIFSDLKLGVLTVNDQGKITYMNKIAQELLRVEENWDTPVTHALQLLLEQTLKKGTRFNQQELCMSFPEGKQYYSFNAAPLCHNGDDGDGKISGAVSVFQDVTQKKNLEDEMLQMEKFSLVAELAAGTAHEIRNPMTTLRGFLQILSREFKPDTRGFEYCSLMVEEIDRANTIIREFLLLTKPAAPKAREIDLHVILEEIFLLIESKSLLENGEIVKNYTRCLPLVKADPAQIKQVFLNLATNAIQAMPSGGCLKISTTAGDGKALVRFTDTGCGISEEQLKKIFNPFFTTKEQGTGLGLTISYRIIENHRGKLHVESIPGRGSTFTVELPAIGVNPEAGGQ